MARILFWALFATLPISVAADEALVAEDIIVTGGRGPIAADAYGRANSVITADEIERRQLREVPEVLRALPGVAVSRSGAAGGFTQVRIRGSEGNHVLVLIDGVEVSAPQSGEFDLAGLLAADIERVEVLRGPQSAFWGSNATAGVISITTKRGERDSFKAGGTVEAGTNGSSLFYGYLSGGAEDFDVSFSVTARRDGGFDVSDDPGGKNDRDRNVTLNSKFNFDITENLQIGGTARFTDRSSDFDAFNFGATTRAGLVTDANNSLRQRELFGSGYIRLETFSGRMEHKLRLDYTDVTSTNVTAGAVSSDVESDRIKAAFQTLIAIDAPTLEAADHTIALAFEWEREGFRNTDPALVFNTSQLIRQERSLFGIAGEYRGTFFDALDLQIGLRYDLNDDFKNAFTYSVGASYRVESTGTRFHGSVGTGVTNPTFFEQFGFIPATFAGNSALKPEENFSWDIGVEQSFLDDRVVIDVTYFRERLDNEIITVFPAPTFIGTPQNVNGTSKRQGIEVAATVTPIDGLELGLTYTWLNASDANGLVEVRRPRHEGGATVSYAFFGGDAKISATGRMVLGNFDSDFTSAAFGAAKVRLDDYFTLNVAGSYRINENITFIGRIDNLTNAEYFELDGFATRGITGFAGLKFAF